MEGLLRDIRYSVHSLRKRPAFAANSSIFGIVNAVILKPLAFKQPDLLVWIWATIGVVGAIVVTRLMRSLLFAVAPTDLTTFAISAVVLNGVALLACFIPARRATKVDQLVALRYD